MRVAIVNDTSGRHFGCQLVMEAFRDQLGRVGVELLGTVPRRTRLLGDYPEFVRRADLVIVNGEGSIHHGKRSELVELADRYPAILINCVYADNPPRDALRKFRFVAARESLSATQLQRHGVPAAVIPDVMLTSRTLNEFPRPIPVEQLGFSDGVLDPKGGFSAKVGAGNARRYLEEVGRYRSLCTGRFHTVLVASVLQIPFSAWASNTHKIEGLLQDMGVGHLYADSRAAAAALVPDTFDERIEAYVTRGKRKIERLFERLEEFI